MKVAALDLGTNSFLCLIAEVESSQITKVYQDEVRLVRLGQGVGQTKLFHPDAISRARTALAEFKKLIDQEKPQKVLALATSAARDVENAEELFQIGRDLDIPIQIIPGSREAEMTFKGAVSGSLENKKRLVIDIGGGSTELIVGVGQKYEAGKSLNLGAVRLTEQFSMRSPLAPARYEEITHFVRTHLVHDLNSLMGFAGGLDEILAVAGTPTELARIEIGDFIPEKINGFILTQEKLGQWLSKFREASQDEITTKFSVHHGRADVILAGTLILSEILKASRFSELKVSTRGVRYGIALEMGA